MYQANPLQTLCIDTNKIHITLQKALRRNGITLFHDFTIIKLDNNYFHQVQQVYVDTVTQEMP